MENPGAPQTFRAWLMQRASDFIYRYHWYLLGLAAAITVFAYFSSQRLELKLNFVDMLSETDPAVVQYRHAVEQFGSLSFLFVVVNAEDLDRGKAYADALAGRLRRDPSFVREVYYKFEIKDYLDDALLFLDPRELSMLAELTGRNREPLAAMLSRPGLVSTVEGLDRMLSNYVAGGETPELSEEDTDFSLVFDAMTELVQGFKEYALHGPGAQDRALQKELLARAFKSGKDLPIDPSEPYLLSRDRKRLLMLVCPTQPAEDFEWCRRLMHYVEAEVKALQRDFPDVPRPQMTGNAAVMRDDNEVIRHDMKLTTVVCFAGIMLLFAFSFRNLSSMVMVAIPLVAGILWSMGAAYWVIGHLTPITAVFGAILLGLGIDYAILILSRYTEERHRGRSIKESLDVAMVQSGVGIITGAAATCLAFFSMTQATFKAGQEMGIIAGMGIIIFVIIMIFVLGSMLVAWDRARESRGPTQRKFNPRIMRLVALVADRGAIPVAAVGAAAVVVMAVIAPRFQFEYNYLNLEPQHVESIQLVHQIPEWFGIDTNYGMVISRSLEDDRKRAAALREKSTVSRVEAISDFIPADQDAKLKLIARMRETLAGLDPGPVPAGPAESAPAMTDEEIERLLAALRSLRDAVGAPGRGLVGLFYLAELEDAEAGARKLLAGLDDLIAALESAPRGELAANLGRLDRETAQGLVKAHQRLNSMLKTEGVTAESLARKHPELVDRFLGKDGSFMIYAYPSVVIWEEQNLKAVARELKEVDPDAMGVAVLFDRILIQIKSDLVKIAVLALGMVFLVILLSYRGLVHTVLTLVPLVAGAVTMVGVMNLIGLKFNIINTGMLPLIIGIGVDYGVYVVHRWIGEGKGTDSIRPVVESTGRAVTLSALTTMIGFASIILAQWRGLSLMGYTLTMGIGFCWLAAVIFLPAVLKVIEMVKARRRSGRGGA